MKINIIDNNSKKLPVKINLFDKCADGLTIGYNSVTDCEGTTWPVGCIHKKGCLDLYECDKSVEIALDGSGLIDIFTEDAFPQVDQLQYLNDVSRAKFKIAWFQEPRIIHNYFHNVDKYKLLDKHFSEYFKEGYFDFIYTHEMKFLQLHSKFRYNNSLAATSTIKTPKIHTKTKFCSMISSSKDWVHGHKIRHWWVSKFRNHAMMRERGQMFGINNLPNEPVVDVFGRGWPSEKNIKEVQSNEDALRDYGFSIVVENDNTDTYFTEKILDCFATGTIPIYWGTSRIVEHFNPNGIIFLKENFRPSQLSANLYHSKMNAIQDNFNRVKEFKSPITSLIDDLTIQLEEIKI